MATPIKIIPTITGDTAHAFVKRAEEHEKCPRKTVIYTESEKQTFYKLLKESALHD